MAAIGAVVLFISLFLHWYQPALTAWTAFEVWDLVLAVLAVATVAVAAADVVSEEPAGERVLGALGGAAFLIVVSQIVNHPPAAQGSSAQVGAWLALFGSAVMAVGGALKLGGLSLSLTMSRQSPERRDPERASQPSGGGYRPTPANEAAEVEPEVHDELYPAGERRGPIGADDPEPWTAGPDDETLSIEPESDERS